MGRLVSVTAAVTDLPNGHAYNSGDNVVLSNEEYAVINTASSAVTDRGAFPLVNTRPTGVVVPTLGALDLLNSDTVQVGNGLAPARTNLQSRYEPCTDEAAVLVTANVVFVPVLLLDGDVVTNVVYKVGATAANTPSHQFVALYGPTGALLHQSADGTSTARAAHATVTTALSAAYTVAAGTGGVYFVGIGFTATTVPSLLSRVYTSDAGLVPLFASLTDSGVNVPLAQQTVGGAYGATAPATISGATGIANSLKAPLVVLT